MISSGCKNCPERIGCFANYRGSECAAKRDKLGLDDPLTNADRIRGMSDAELAHEMALIAGWNRREYAKAKKIGIEKVIADWLQKPCHGRRSKERE